MITIMNILKVVSWFLHIKLFIQSLDIMLLACRTCDELACMHKIYCCNITILAHAVLPKTRILS